MSDRPSVLERLSTAMGSSDLSMDTIHRGDLDYIVAIGIASARHSAVAAPMMRLHLASTPSALRGAFQSVLGLAKRMNAKKGWRLNARSLQVVSLNALSHHINPICPHCHGRKYELIEGAPALSATACKICHGTGRRAVQKKYRDQINQVITALEQIDDITERAVARLVR